MKSFLDELLEAYPESRKESARSRLRVAVAEDLLLHLERSGMSKAQLASQLGVSRSAVSQALTGTRNMSLNLLADMADALGLHPQFMLRTAEVAQASAARYDLQRLEIRADASRPTLQFMAATAVNQFTNLNISVQ